jgi:hypothetical protein
MPLHCQIRPILPRDLALLFPAHSEAHDRTMMASIVAFFGHHISAIEEIQPTKL